MFEVMKLKATEMTDRWRASIKENGSLTIDCREATTDLFGRLIITVIFGDDFSQKTLPMHIFERNVVKGKKEMTLPEAILMSF